MKGKYLIITVDTEGDNLWNYHPGDDIKVENSYYIPRFQELCNRYGFIPVYLTNYEMALSEKFVHDAREWISQKQCEIGIHLHAWNTPPTFELPKRYEGNPYLIEYPTNIMYSKFKTVYNLIVEKFGVKPISHRAGRWAMNEIYFKILHEFGIKIDCSYTPGIDWSLNMGATQGGSNYSAESFMPCLISGVYELPTTIRTLHTGVKGSLKHQLKVLITGEPTWLRPAGTSLTGMKKILDIVLKDDTIDYAEFMIHSSELMPGGSPYFESKEDVEREFHEMEEFFKYARKNNFKGISLADYYKMANTDIID